MGRGFIVESTTNLDELRAMLEGYIENFETQSGTPEERQPEVVVSSLIKVMDRSNAPAVNWNDPLALEPGFKEAQSTASKPRTSPKATAEKLAILNSQISALSSELKSTIISTNRELIEAIKSSSQPVSPLSSSINWTPIVQGLVQGVASSLGATINFPSQPSQVPSQPVSQTPAIPTSGEVQNVSSQVSQIKELIKAEISPLVNKVNNLESMLTRLAETTNSQISQVSSTVETLARVVEAQITQKDPQGVNGGGSSSAPATPTAPTVEEEIISPISGVGRKTTEQLAKENLGFSPFPTKEQLAELEAEWEAENGPKYPLPQGMDPKGQTVERIQV